MIRIIIVTIFFCSINIYANDIADRNRELLLTPKKNISISDLEKYPEIYRMDNSILKQRDSDTSILSDAYFTLNDPSRLSVTYGLSHDYEDITKVISLDINYLDRFENSYQGLWWGMQFKSVSGKYSALADERVSTTGNSNSVANTTRSENIQSFSILGLGFGHQFKALAQAWETNRLFEVISIYGNYIIHSDSTDSQTYSGYGYTADYQLSYRTNNSFFYGGKISYNWALVEGEQIGTELLIDRSLVFGWTTLGLEIGYFL